MSRLSEVWTGRWQGAPLSLTSPISGFRLRGRNDGCAKVSDGESTAPKSSFPRGIVIGNQGPSIVDGGRRRTHNRHPRDGGNPSERDGARVAELLPNGAVTDCGLATICGVPQGLRIDGPRGSAVTRASWPCRLGLRLLELHDRRKFVYWFDSMHLPLGQGGPGRYRRSPPRRTTVQRSNPYMTSRRWLMNSKSNGTLWTSCARLRRHAPLDSRAISTPGPPRGPPSRPQ